MIQPIYATPLHLPLPLVCYLTSLDVNGILGIATEVCAEEEMVKPLSLPIIRPLRLVYCSHATRRHPW